jgi:hypothetical protein
MFLNLYPELVPPLFIVRHILALCIAVGQLRPKQLPRSIFLAASETTHSMSLNVTMPTLLRVTSRTTFFVSVLTLRLQTVTLLAIFSLAPQERNNSHPCILHSAKGLTQPQMVLTPLRLSRRGISLLFPLPTALASTAALRRVFTTLRVPITPRPAAGRVPPH